MARDTEQAEAIIACGKVAIFTALEGARLLGTADPITRFRDLIAYAGLKYITLTHNRNNLFTESATDVPFDSIHGITNLGYKLIQIACDEKVIIDVSHSSDRVVVEAVDNTRFGSVWATHSGARSILNNPRNLSDDLILKITDNGGLVGIPFARRFVDTLDGVCQHINHVCQLIGNDKHVAIGSDIDGAMIVKGLKTIDKWSKVGERLSEHYNYSDEAIERIMGGNVSEEFSKYTRSDHIKRFNIIAETTESIFTSKVFEAPNLKEAIHQADAEDWTDWKELYGMSKTFYSIRDDMCEEQEN